MMLQVWSFLGALFAVEGLLALIAYAVAKVHSAIYPRSLSMQQQSDARH